jgi:hypothetical protein
VGWGGGVRPPPLAPNPPHQHPPVMTVRAEKPPTKTLPPSTNPPHQHPPVMTVRAEKSTRLPMRFPRMRPCLPLSRWLMDLMGRPLFCCAGGWPGRVLSM